MKYMRQALDFGTYSYIVTHVPAYYIRNVTLGNIIFVTRKIICVSYVFFQAELMYVIRVAL